MDQGSGHVFTPTPGRAFSNGISFSWTSTNAQGGTRGLYPLPTPPNFLSTLLRSMLQGALLTGPTTGPQAQHSHSHTHLIHFRPHHTFPSNVSFVEQNILFLIPQLRTQVLPWLSITSLPRQPTAMGTRVQSKIASLVPEDPVWSLYTMVSGP